MALKNLKYYSKNAEKAIRYLWIDMDIKKKETAFNLLWEAASKGEGDAFFLLSKCYMGDKEIFPGFGFEKDVALAAEYQKHALELGSALAWFVERGIKGCNMDRSSFLNHYTPRELWDIVMERAVSGDVFAQVAMGDMFFYFRLSTFWDLPYLGLSNMFGNAWYMEAVKWYEKAVKKGFVNVITNINKIYTDGRYEVVPRRDYVLKNKRKMLKYSDEICRWITKCSRDEIKDEMISFCEKIKINENVKKGIKSIYITRPIEDFNILVNQSREKPPIIMVAPFTSSHNCEKVPYEASLEELKDCLKKEMKYYQVAVIALAWKNTEETFQLLKKELNNEDGYRRRFALENIEYHSLWKENRFLVRNMLLDNNLYVIRLALRIVTMRNMEGLVNEVLYIMEQFEQDEEIMQSCRFYLDRNGIDYQEILNQRKLERGNYGDVHIWEQASQKAPEGNMYDTEDFATYVAIIREYNPDVSEEECQEILLEISLQGCGYACLIATVLQHYTEQQREFKRTFGISFVDEDGQTCFNELLIRFYCMTKTGEYGMTLAQMNERFEQFCRYYGIEAEVELAYRIMEDDFDENTYVLMVAKDFVMRENGGKRIHVKEGHCLNVHRIVAPNTYNVYSWGRSYLLRKTDIVKGYWFLKVKYKRKGINNISYI